MDEVGYRAHKHQAAPTIVGCAVLTISSSRTPGNDESGKIIQQKLLENKHRVIHYEIVKDDAQLIGTTVKRCLNNLEIQVVITDGGTGISPKDCTMEAITPLLEKELTGFGELFRWLSYQEIGSPSMMSRATAGVVKGKVVICLHGSPGAASLAMEKLIVPELPHLVWEANR
jgi:molybdenum cofactor biosynthesis protein B